MGAVVSSILDARAEMERHLQAYLRKCDELRTLCRRRAPDESSAGYRTFATMQLRLGGAINQALKRAEVGTRILDSVKAEAAESSRETDRERRRFEVAEVQRSVQKSLLPTHDDFESLYGDHEEGVD